MAFIVEVDNVPQKNSVLVYKDNKWVAIPRELFLLEVTNLKLEMEKFRTEMNSNLEVLKTGINDRLKDYHDIIQNLIQGEQVR